MMSLRISDLGTVRSTLSSAHIAFLNRLVGLKGRKSILLCYARTTTWDRKKTRRLALDSATLSLSSLPGNRSSSQLHNNLNHSCHAQLAATKNYVAACGRGRSLAPKSFYLRLERGDAHSCHLIVTDLGRVYHQWFFRLDTCSHA